jgi:subtilisin family serine protease
VITVGGFDDNNTPTWTDDSLYTCTSFANPASTNGDREKPELVAPARNLTTAGVGPASLVTQSGTSGAAPLVTATVAMLIQRNNTLSVWPEIARAVLMATATHNIEGASRLSSIDGAGGLVADAAGSLVTDPARTDGRRYTCDSTTASPLNLATIAVGPRTRQRVVLSWDSDPAFADYSTRPSADIDLELVDSFGRVVAASRSFDNTNEIVEFDSWLAGTYTLRAVKFRCDRTTWLGWAWHTLPMPSLKSR